MIVDQLYQLPQQHLLELGGIYTGATALIDPDTNKPYEKTKMAKKASDSRAARAAAARAATAISLPQTTAQVPAAPIASTAMPPSAVPVTATAQVPAAPIASTAMPPSAVPVTTTAADIRASKLATAGAAAQSQMAVGTTVAKTPAASGGGATASNFDDPAVQAVEYAKQLSISDLEKIIGTGTGTAQQRQIYSDVLAKKKANVSAKFTGPAAYAKTTTPFAAKIPGASGYDKITSPTSAAPAAAPTKTPTQAEKDAYLKAINAPALPETIKQVKKMLETVQTRDDVNFIKKYINHEFDRLGMVNQLATVQRNHLIERVTQVGAQRRRNHAKQLAN